MNIKKNIVYIVPIILCIIMSGCQNVTTQIAKVTQHDNVRTYTIESQHYHMRTDMKKKNAIKLLEAMENNLLRYQTITGIKKASKKKYVIYTFSHNKDYDAFLASLGYSVHTTRGLFTPAPEEATYLPLENRNMKSLLLTLSHEGMHQFLHDHLSFIEQEKGAKKLCIPLWLNEGLAMSIEPSNKERKTHFKKVLKKTQNIPALVNAVLISEYGDEFTQDQYAVAWGLVYALQNNSKVSLKSYLKTSVEQIYTNLEQGIFEDWYAFVTEKFFDTFMQIVIDDDSQNFYEWCKNWKAFLLST